MPLKTHADEGNPARDYEDRTKCEDITPDVCKERGPRGSLWVGGGDKKYAENWERIFGNES